MNDPCELLLWDTEFFGFRVGRVRGNTLTPEIVKKVDEWCRQIQVRCLYFLARLDDPPTVRLAEENGFHYADVRITFERQIVEKTNLFKSVYLRPARKEDTPNLADIARQLYYDTRYFFDDQFPRQLSESLYKIWIMRSIEGYAEEVLIAESDKGLPLGYISCHLEGDPLVGKIGLIGVSREATGQKIGQRLVNGALGWFTAREIKSVVVVTQGRNYAAQRLYQRCGFLTHSVELWYHKWFSVDESKCE